jgi:hypothetical protein
MSKYRGNKLRLPHNIKSRLRETAIVITVSPRYWEPFDMGLRIVHNRESNPLLRILALGSQSREEQFECLHGSMIYQARDHY